VPVLARTLESAGLSTVLVTNMPFWAEKAGVPRTLAVEFPFGQMLGRPGEIEQQRRVVEQALAVLEKAEAPGTIVHSPEMWPLPAEQAMKDWQPDEPSPVMDVLRPHVMKLMRQRRRRG